MNEQSPLRLWLMRASFVLLTLVILFFQLLPLDTTPRGWAGPDVLLCFGLAWALRRPEYVPAPLLAAVFLLADFLLQRPPGLWALLALIGCEYLKGAGRGLRDATFPAEWLSVAVTVAAILMGYRIGLAITLIPTPSWGLSLFELGFTVLCYPLIAAISHYLMGVRKAAPGELDALGKRV